MGSLLGFAGAGFRSLEVFEAYRGVARGGKLARFTEDDLFIVPSHFKTPDVKVNYVDGLKKTEGAYGLFRDGEIFVQTGMDPDFTKGVIRHEYAQLKYDEFSPVLSSLYFRSYVAKVAEELGVHIYVTGSIRKGVQFTERYLKPWQFSAEIGLLTAGVYFAYEWVFDE